MYSNVCAQAGQATEPEAMISIGLVAGKDGQVRLLDLRNNV